MDKFYDSKPEDYYSLDRFKILLPFIPDKMEKVLDVGCSEGWFGKSLKEKKSVKEVWGIEPFDNAIPNATKNLDKVIHSTIENAIEQLPDGYFDCIFFNDVLEHLVDPYTVLEKIRTKCKKDGCIVASIPNVLNYENIFQILKKRDWEYKDFGIMDRTHLRFFTKKSIRRMFEEAGYQVEVTGTNKFYGKKFAILNFFLFNWLDEMKYIHMIAQAKPRQAK
jgi:2-polyprenyl-3-methyl-5-hydroxy-6-metoxy-1,4-benzoquinol methylase